MQLTFGGEIIGSNFLCNLVEVHLNKIDPKNIEEIKNIFYTAGVEVASLLHHEFDIEKFQYSRKIDPIVGVSFTGLFDFFVNLFGVDWLKWWESGRNLSYSGASEYSIQEKIYLYMMRESAELGVQDYCKRNNLRIPNRCTTVQPAGTKSLLTGASPGWHPPKSSRYIRRITFKKDDPVAKACMDYGYSVVPSQSDKDENGYLLNDPFDSRCTEWLVEIPVEVSWANLPGADQIDPNKFSVEAQYDFYMQVQKYYTTHNCFSRNTEFLTKEGVKTFNDFNEGSYVSVLNAEGNWSSSRVVKTSHLKEMYDITLKLGGSNKTKVIRATECHRFPVRTRAGFTNIKTKTTKELKPGYTLLQNSLEIDFDLDPKGVVHGLVYGDGTLYKNKKGEFIHSQLYLMGEKRELSVWVEKAYPEINIISRDDINQTRIYSLPKEFKSLPEEDSSQEYLAGFIAGWLATDGNIRGSTISISFKEDWDTYDWLERQVPRLGINLTSTKTQKTSNRIIKGIEVKDGSYQSVIFSKTTFPESLVLRSFHLKNLTSKTSQPRLWRVESVDYVGQDYGWCVMEPVTNQFTLKDNILVFNTSATLEFREDEIDTLAELIYNSIQSDEGYVSAALLARFDANETFPRLPFEPISKEDYETLMSEVLFRRKSENFHELLLQYDVEVSTYEGPSGCDSDKCLLPERK